MPHYNGGCWHKRVDQIMTESGTYQPGMCRECHVLVDMRTGKRMSVRQVQDWSIEITTARLDNVRTKILGGDDNIVFENTTTADGWVNVNHQRVTEQELIKLLTTGKIENGQSLNGR